MRKYIKGAGAVVLSVAAVWIFVRFLLPLCAPLLLSLLLAAMLDGTVKKLTAHGWKRSYAAAVLTLLLTAVLCSLAYIIVYKGIGAMDGLIRSLPELIGKATLTLDRWRAVAEKYIASAPKEARLYLSTALSSAGKAVEKLPTVLYDRAAKLISSAAQSGPDMLLFIITLLLGTYFACASYPKLVRTFNSVLSESVRERLWDTRCQLKSSFSGYIRSQLILMALTFSELIAAFLILKVKNALLIAAVTAVVDALPVFGVGAVLLPWAAAALLTGQGSLALGLTVSWIIIALVRNLAQAKLVGDRIGLSPFASLSSIYVGYKSCGIWGMILFPILLALIAQVRVKH